MNFDTLCFRSHYVGKLMSKAKGKSNMEKYLDAKESFAKKQSDLELCSDKAVKTKEKLIKDLSILNDTIQHIDRYKPHLSDTCKSKLIEIYTQETTGRIKDITNKYIKKGLLVEEDSITQHSLFLGVFHKKNVVRKSNGLISGEADIETEKEITDTKSSWDIFTFDAVTVKPIDPVYHWQLDCYMWLYGKESAVLSYNLINTPEQLIAIEERRLIQQFIGDPDSLVEALRDLRFKHTYDDLPIGRKVRLFKVDRDEERISQIESSVPIWRDYLNNIDNVKKEDLQEDDDPESAF